MSVRVWPNESDQSVPGGELFRSDRSFTVWAYTGSHSQLLLRTRTTSRDGSRSSRRDLVFKPILAMKVRTEYKTASSSDAPIRRRPRTSTGESSNVEPTAGAQCPVLGTGDDRTTSWRMPSAGHKTWQASGTRVLWPASHLPSDPARILG